MKRGKKKDGKRVRTERQKDRTDECRKEDATMLRKTVGKQNDAKRTESG